MTRHLAVDLFDFPKVRDVVANLRPEWLVHLAWHHYVPDYLASPSHLDWTTASRHLFEVFSKHRGQRAVLAGSIYEVTLADTPYSVAKAQLRDDILKSATRVGISAAWCRFYGTYGPGDPPHKFIPSLIESLLKGQGAEPHNPNLCRDYLHVADVADAVVAVLESDLEGIVDIASGRSVALKDLYAALRELVAASNLPAIPTTPTHPPIAGALQRSGWRQAIPLEAGLRQTVEWHRQKAATT